jgi:hypothetical protein
VSPDYIEQNTSNDMQLVIPLDPCKTAGKGFRKEVDKRIGGEGMEVRDEMEVEGREAKGEGKGRESRSNRGATEFGKEREGRLTAPSEQKSCVWACGSPHSFY